MDLGQGMAGNRIGIIGNCCFGTEMILLLGYRDVCEAKGGKEEQLQRGTT